MITNPDLMYELMRSRQSALQHAANVRHFREAARDDRAEDVALTQHVFTILARFTARARAARSTVVASHAYQVLTTGTFAVL
jgi:hypothetical protein